MASETQQDLLLSARIIIPANEFEWTFSRASGPGGQNVNKVNSKALLRWRPLESPVIPLDVKQRLVTRYAPKLTTDGELLIDSEEFRDQPQNVRRCLEKLKELLLTVLQAPKKRRPTKPSAGSHRRRLEGKKRRSEIKSQRRNPEL